MACYVYQNKSVKTLIILLFVALTICGCDSHKGERASLSTQITAIEAELVRFKSEQDKVSKALGILASDIEQQTDSLKQHTNRRTKLQDELSLYVLDNKMTTLVLATTVASIGAVLNENTDQKTKDSLNTAGVVGLILAGVYCSNYPEDCASVTAKIAYYGSQIKAESNSISGITAQLSQNKLSLQEHEKKNSSLGDMIAKRISERDALKQKHDSLLCKLCF
jgi:chromosome segregation ATPase